MRKLFLFLILICSFHSSHAQFLKYFNGGFESNLQLLTDDEGLDFTAPDENFRSNTYFLLNFNKGKFSAGLQYEAYSPLPLLGYDPRLKGHDLAIYYLDFRHKELEVTAGYFYEQFGSGLILRFWEDRQLGINNAVRGGRVKYSPLASVDLTALYGEQRVGFDISEADIAGLDANIAVGRIFEVEDFDLDLGLSYVARYQEAPEGTEIPSTVGAFSGRFDFIMGGFSAGFEAVYKEPDVLVYNRSITNAQNLYDGSALLLNLGFAKSGFGFNTSFRRLENFSFYADRFAEGNQYNQQLISYVPALTVQHDFLLNNIYVYNAQPRLILQTFQKQAGEIGGQADVFYTFDKDTPLGGNYGTNLSFNFSWWSGLDADFDVGNNSYDAEFLGAGDRLFRELSLEIKKKWTKNYTGIYSFTNLMIDEGVLIGKPLGISRINANIGVIENSFRLGKGKSFRLQLQHLWTRQDRKNWAAGLVEFNFTPNLGVYILDSWNYGGEDKIHYYNFGSNYSSGRVSLSLNYGRQRGGLICVGGVCRFVPENSGLSVNLAATF